MESKNKSGAFKSKRSKRRLLTKSDNYINSNETNKTIDKSTLKTRGPYVVRNRKLDSNDPPDDQGRKEIKSSPEQNQRKFSSTTVTTSLVGNRKFITHQIVKTKRKNKNSRERQEIMTSSVINKSSKNCKEKSQIHKKYKEDNDVIYVLPSRNIYQSVTNTNSVVSKQIDDSHSTLCNKELLNEGCSGAERIADEVLEGWIKRKEKRLKGSEHSSVIGKEKTDEVLINLCIDLDENTKSDHKVEQNCSTCSKYNDKYQKMIQPTISGKTYENIYDIDINDRENEISKIFFIVENDTDQKVNYPHKKMKYRKLKVPIRQNLKTQSFIQPKFTKQYNTSNSHKEIRRNSKREFINIIKRELQMPSEIYKKPRNMFDALTVLAKNRNKTKHGISFDDSTSKTKWPNDTECQYDNSKLIQAFKRYKYLPKTKLFNHGQQIHRGSKTKKKLMPSLEVKHFHKSPDKRLRVITI